MSKMIKVSDDLYEWLTQNKRGSYSETVQYLRAFYEGKRGRAKKVE